MSMFVEPAFAVDIGCWFRYRHRCVGAFESNNPFIYVLISAESILEYKTIDHYQTYNKDEA